MGAAEDNNLTVEIAAARPTCSGYEILVGGLFPAHPFDLSGFIAVRVHPKLAQIGGRHA